MKKIIFLSSIMLLNACSLFGSSQSTIPAEFAQADYLLSDANAKTWAVASKQAEQCIYPNLTRIQQQKSISRPPEKIACLSARGNEATNELSNFYRRDQRPAGAVCRAAARDRAPDGIHHGGEGVFLYPRQVGYAHRNLF